MADGGDDVDSQNDEEFKYDGGKSAVIFLIDSRLPMFTKDFADGDDGECSKFYVAIKCVRSMLMNKIIAKQKDLVGVVLFGTDTPDSKTNTKHVSLLLDLNYPRAESVSHMDKLLEDPDFVELQRTHGTSDDFLLADALWYCNSLFNHSGEKNLEDKRILVFTGDDDPHRSDSNHAHMARKRARDFHQFKISLELVAMGSDFDSTKFYNELLEIVNGSGFEMMDPSTRLEQLLERINRLEFRTRRYSKIKLHLGNAVCVGISLYTLYREASIMSKEALYRATNEPVKTIRQTFDQGTGELLLHSDIEEFISIGGKEIVFTNEDKQLMKKIMEPGMVLLGFKDKSFASEAQHCGEPAFAYPEETLVKGSQALIKALVERCFARNKVALCCVTPRLGAITKYVCLVPARETMDQDKNQVTACGFHVIPLPFYNDVRDQNFEKSPKIDVENIELCKSLIKKLKFSYKPSSFKNPKLQQFWAHLEALALEYDSPEAIEDMTAPDAEAQTQRIGHLATQFNNAFDLTGHETVANKRASKLYKPLTERDCDPKPKRSKDIDVIQEINKAIPIRKVDKFTMAHLKEYLSFFNVPTSGLKKADLVQAVYNRKQK